MAMLQCERQAVLTLHCSDSLAATCVRSHSAAQPPFRDRRSRCRSLSRCFCFFWLALSSDRGLADSSTPHAAGDKRPLSVRVERHLPLRGIATGNDSSTVRLVVGGVRSPATELQQCSGNRKFTTQPQLTVTTAQPRRRTMRRFGRLLFVSDHVCSCH